MYDRYSLGYTRDLHFWNPHFTAFTAFEPSRHGFEKVEKFQIFPVRISKKAHEGHETTIVLLMKHPFVQIFISRTFLLYINDVILSNRKVNWKYVQTWCQKPSNSARSITKTNNREQASFSWLSSFSKRRQKLRESKLSTLSSSRKNQCM